MFVDYWQHKRSDKDNLRLAYVLETAHHEGDLEMQPIKKYGTDSYFKRMYGIEV